ncbi:hypothetical protein KI387_038055, partial [Taxus chinensis]
MARLVFVSFTLLLLLCILWESQGFAVSDMSKAGEESLVAYPNALQSVHPGAQQPPTKSHVCFTVTNAVQSACVFHLEHMETSSSAPATTTGRPKEEAPNALESETCIASNL